jgi:hypothetical protein
LLPAPGGSPAALFLPTPPGAGPGTRVLRFPPQCRQAYTFAGRLSNATLAAKGEYMSAVLLGVFKDYEAAENVLVGLVRDGFPTDRVELTCRHSPGRAGEQPAASLHDKLAQYFGTLFCTKDEQPLGQQLVEMVEGGAVTVTIHPRGSIEVARANELLRAAGATEVASHDMDNQAFEHAAARKDVAWIRNFWIPAASTEYHCIYCRMFDMGSHH